MKQTRSYSENPVWYFTLFTKFDFFSEHAHHALDTKHLTRSEENQGASDV